MRSIVRSGAVDSVTLYIVSLVPNAMLFTFISLPLCELDRVGDGGIESLIFRHSA